MGLGHKPMSLPCQRCHKAKATVHITDTLPEKRERHLCEDCAVAEGITVKANVPISQLLESFILQSSSAGIVSTRCHTLFSPGCSRQLGPR